MEIADIKDVSVFTEYVGSLFYIEIDPNQFVEIRLIEAANLSVNTRSPDLPPRVPFSLLFATQGDIELQQQTYRVSHKWLGDLPLFLTPVGRDRVESVFN